MSHSDSSAQSREDDARQRPNWLSERNYWIGLVFSCAASLVLIVLSFGQPLGDSAHSIGYEARNGLSCMLGKIGASPPMLGECVPGTTLHALPDFPTGIVQILGILVISYIWVNAFVSGIRLRMLFSALASLAYVLGMFRVYQPAVLVAALVAILAAAEQLRAQEDQTKRLESQRDLLGMAMDALDSTKSEMEAQTSALSSQTNLLTEQTANLKKQKSTMDKVVDNIVRISNSTQLSLNEAGKELFMQDVFGAYSRAHTIYAVVRTHPIDREWWLRAMSEDIRYDLTNVWQAYLAAEPSTGDTAADLTLYRALTQERVCNEHEPEMVCGVTSAYFVSALPMPSTRDWTGDDSHAHRSQLFANLLGLVWECLVLDEVRRKLYRAESVGGWISRPLCWAHATDKEVWQVIKRNPFEASTVLKTADLVDAADNNLDRDLSAKIIESTQAEIRRYLRRGVPAEEYLCALLCYAAANDPHAILHEDPGSHEHDSNIANCLHRLFMDAWLADKPSEREVRKDIAVALFKQFIDLCWRRSAPGAVAGIPPPVKTSLCLAREVL